MIRQLCTLGLCVVFVGAVVAAEPEKKEPAKRSRKSAPLSATPATPLTIPSTRRQLEELLETPARLDFKDRKRVTVGDVLDRLHEQHDLSLRFDAPTLASLLAPAPRTTPVGCPPAMT